MFFYNYYSPIPQPHLSHSLKSRTLVWMAHKRPFPLYYLDRWYKLTPLIHIQFSHMPRFVPQMTVLHDSPPGLDKENEHKNSKTPS